MIVRCESSVTSPLRGDTIKQAVSSRVANIPTFKGEHHQWRLDDLMLLPRPGYMDISQISQNGIEFLQEPVECQSVTVKVGWIDILQQRALRRKRYNVTLILHSQ